MSTDDASVEVPAPTPIKVWYDDGTLDIRAGETNFRVYAGILSKASSVFADMFVVGDLDQSKDTDRLPFVYLSDSPLDVSYFLKALHDIKFFLPPPVATAPLPVIAGILRVSTKYEALDLRRRALLHLSSIYPTALWAVGKFPRFYYRSLHDHVIALNLARELNIPWIRPMALYACSLASLSSLLRSYDASALQKLDLEICLSEGAMIKNEVLIYITTKFEDCEDVKCEGVRKGGLLFLINENHVGKDLLTRLTYDSSERDKALCAHCRSEICSLRMQTREYVFNVFANILDLEWEGLRKLKSIDLEPPADSIPHQPST